MSDLDERFLAGRTTPDRGPPCAFRFHCRPARIYWQLGSHLEAPSRALSCTPAETRVSTDDNLTSPMVLGDRWQTVAVIGRGADGVVWRLAEASGSIAARCPRT